MPGDAGDLGDAMRRLMESLPRHYQPEPLIVSPTLLPRMAAELAKLEVLVADLTERARAAEQTVMAATRQRDEARRRIEELEADRDRYRKRIHELASEGQKRQGRLESELAELRALMREAGRRHAEQMESEGKPGYVQINAYGQAAMANILAERDEAREQIVWWQATNAGLVSQVATLTRERNEAQGELVRALGELAKARADAVKARREAQVKFAGAYIPNRDGSVPLEDDGA